MKITVLNGRFAVCRLAPNSSLPEWWQSATFCSVTRTAHELSIVCEEASVPPGVRAETGWAALALAGPIPFQTTGVLSRLAGVLASAGLSVFAIATFDTDYVLVKAAGLETAVEALNQSGYCVEVNQ